MFSRLKAAWTWVRAEILTYPMWLPAALAAILAQGTTLGWWTLDPTQTGEVTAVVTAVLGLATAFLTANVGVTVIVTALQTVAALSIGFTYNGSDRVALYIGAVVAFIGFLGHTQNSPNYGPRGLKSAAAAGIAYGQTALGHPIGLSVTNPSGDFRMPSNVAVKPTRKLSGAAAASHAKKQAKVPPEHSVS